jgi:hypothetical protein
VDDPTGYSLAAHRRMVAERPALVGAPPAAEAVRPPA